MKEQNGYAVLFEEIKSVIKYSSGIFAIQIKKEGKSYESSNCN